MNVVITHSPRSAVSEIFGYINLAHLLIYNKPIKINYEASRFEATRFRRPLLEDWNDVIDADPQILLDRGYDKVIHVNRDLLDLCEAQALYHRQSKTVREIITLVLSEPNFFKNIKKKRERTQKDIDDPRFLRIDLQYDWNNHLFLTYNKILDFLEFPKEGRPLIVPVKSKQNFEAYSNSFLPKDYKVCENIEVIRNATT